MRLGENYSHSQAEERDRKGSVVSAISGITDQTSDNSDGIGIFSMRMSGYYGLPISTFGA